MRMTHARSLSVIVLAVLAACSGGGGGGGTNTQFGTISGTVTANNVGVAGVTVALSGGGSTTTSASGQFTLSNVGTGARTLTITPPASFIASTHGGETKQVQVSAGQTASATFAIIPGVIVTAAGTSFSPATVTIPAGGTVRWVNGGGSHTVTPDNAGQAGAWASATLPGGSFFEVTFGAAGSFPYHCNPHQAMGMTGTVTVS